MTITHAPSEYIVIDKRARVFYFPKDFPMLFIVNEWFKYSFLDSPQLSQADHQDFVKCNYIGLNDKDGNKVYEGDLFNYCGIGMWVVRWSHKECKYILASCFDKNIVNIEKIYRDSKVGNIYLNPELMEGL